MPALVKRIAEIKPGIIGVTSNVSNAGVAVETCVNCKNSIPGAREIIGGPWATINWKYVVKNGYADYAVIGEGEHTMAELADAISKNDADLSLVKGLAYQGCPRHARSHSRQATHPGSRRAALSGMAFVQEIESLQFSPQGYHRLSHDHQPWLPV